MKARVSSLLVLLAIMSSSLVPSLSAAAPKPPVAYSHLVKSVDSRGNKSVTCGASRPDVEWELGAPHHKLGENVWIYLNFSGGRAQSPDDDCSRLMITFTNDRVSNLELVNERAEQIYAARIAEKAAAQTQVAAKEAGSANHSR